jgi:hypothetical protein
MTNQFTHIADFRVGKLRGNSKIYPQLRLPSQYAELAGKTASIYEINGLDGGAAFLIRFDNEKHVAAYNGDTHPEGCVADGPIVPVQPCRGSDSGSNPDSGASFLLFMILSKAVSKKRLFSSSIFDSNVFT